MSGKIGLVLEGGAMRGIYTAGVLDYLMEQNVKVPYVVGVSAGAGNGLNYVSGQIGRSKKVISHENLESYYGFKQRKKSKKMLDVHKLVVEYANETFPYDYDAFINSGVECETVVINCETGLAEYKSDYANKDEFFLYNQATVSVPFVCEPIEIEGNHYLDGSLADSIPAKRAVEKGCDKIIVVLTRPEGGKPTNYKKVKHLIRVIYKKYPKLRETMCNRKATYLEQMEYLNKMVEEGKAFVIRPENETIGHFEDDSEKLNGCYQAGYDMMKKKFGELKEFMEK